MDDYMTLRRSARRACLESKAEFEATLSQDSMSTPPMPPGRKRHHGNESSEGTPSVWEKRVKREWVEGREAGRRMHTRSSRPLMKRHRAAVRHLHGRGGKPEPLRRSKREKRLMFANFTPSEIDRTIFNRASFHVIEDSSEDEMDPYEKLLSPLRKVTTRRQPHSSAEHMTLRSSSQSSKPHAPAPEGEGILTDRSDNQGEAEEGGSAKEKEGEEDVRQETKEAPGSSEGEEEEEEEEEQVESESEGEEGERGYFLRKRRPVIYQYQPVIQVVEEDPPPKRRLRRQPRRSSTSYYSKRPQSSAPTAYQPRRTHSSSASARMRAAHQDSTTTSSGSDSDEARFRRRKARSMAKARTQCLPMNFAPEDLSQGVVRDRVRIGASLADVDPMNIDQSITFESIGGLRHHIRTLKEMIIFPLLYPEVFEWFKIQPPRGVLFHGPPGCGKTLVARALANECSKGGKKVAFFMRKGADCLSKWVGESERQLRLLFDQAYQVRPSIIFFDEIDGLAPVRSSRQDQIHSSIVSTLLALMDGLDSRGEIVVIGATNRIDVIDPALRRPGRFDREFHFPLPSREDRCSILEIHTKPWHPPLRAEFLSELADSTVGYCGADLRALCTEAALFALRRKYPQIYHTSDKLVLDVSKISISAADFHNALGAIVPTAQRSDSSVACVLSEGVRPLLLRQFGTLLSLVSFMFPPCWKAVIKAQKYVEAVLKHEEARYEQMEARIAALRDGEIDCTHTGEEPALRRRSHANDLSFSNRVNIRSGTGVSQSRPRFESRGFCLPNSSAEDGNPSDQFSQLYQSSQPAELEEVYFDISDAVFEEGVESQSILTNQIAEYKPQNSQTSQMSTSTFETTPESFEEPGENFIQPPLLAPRKFLSLASHPHATPPSHRPRLILCGEGGMGQSAHLAPALLHALEDMPVKILDLPALFATSTKTPEEACTQVFREARRVAPSVIYIPQLSSWWEVTTDTLRATFLSTLHSLPPSTPLLLIATSESPWDKLPLPLREIFSLSGESFSLSRPSPEERKLFFSQVLLHKPLLPPPPRPKQQQELELDELPVAAPPEPRELTEGELGRMDKQRQAVLRELRMFLRDATNKILAERKFKEFVNPVNPEEVTDYYDIIEEPMDLGTVMKKIDEHKYTTPKQWLQDIDLIARNALEYNPEHDSESRLLRHRAVALQDMAHSFLDHELSEDFEKQCEEIEEAYNRLGRKQQYESVCATSTNQSSQAGQTGLSEHLLDSPRRSLRQKGLQPVVRGLPYYAPSRPRTPKKPSRDGTSGEVDGESPIEVGDNVEEEMKFDESPQGDSILDTSLQIQNGVTRVEDEQVKVTRTGNSSYAAGQDTDTSPPDLDKNVSSLSRKPLRNSLVRRQILNEDMSSAANEDSKKPETNGRSSLRPRSRSRGGRRSTSSASQNDEIPPTSKDPLTRASSENQGANSGGAGGSCKHMETSPLSTEYTQGQTQQQSESMDIPTFSAPVSVDRKRLLALFEQVVLLTGSCSVENMEKLHATFEHLVFRYRMKTDRSQLVEDLESATELLGRC